MAGSYHQCLYNIGEDAVVTDGLFSSWLYNVRQMNAEHFDLCYTICTWPSVKFADL